MVLSGIKVVIGIVLLLACASCNEKGNPDSGRITENQRVDKDPLPSWNDGTIKQAIIKFVREAIDSSSPGYIPAAARIATFDNDGTLWAERPYVQELFAGFMVKKMVRKHPRLAESQPFKAAIEKDKAWFEKGGAGALLQLIQATHTGMSEESFDSSVREFFSTTTYPGLNKPVKKIVYQPQLELLQFLRSNGFLVYMCTGGTTEFVRSVSEELYGIPSQQVIGTSFRYQFIDSSRSILRRPEIVHNNDKNGKPATIQEHIGKRPVFACGNEGGAGDIAMLKFSQGSSYPSFQLLVNHDDPTREFAYQEKDSASLKAAAENRWHVLSMKTDWKLIFPSN